MTKLLMVIAFIVYRITLYLLITEMDNQERFIKSQIADTIFILTFILMR